MISGVNSEEILCGSPIDSAHLHKTRIRSNGFALCAALAITRLTYIVNQRVENELSSPESNLGTKITKCPTSKLYMWFGGFCSDYRLWLKSYWNAILWSTLWKEMLGFRPNLPSVFKPVQGLPDTINHDDVIKWKHFPRYWTFVRGIHRGPVNSPHKGQWRGTLTFSLICVWLNGWENNHQGPVSLKIFPTEFKFDGNLILLSPKF